MAPPAKSTSSMAPKASSTSVKSKKTAAAHAVKVNIRKGGQKPSTPPLATRSTVSRTRRSPTPDSMEEIDEGDDSYRGESLPADSVHLLEEVDGADGERGGSASAAMDVDENEGSDPVDIDAEIEELRKTWVSPIYGFFEATPLPETNKKGDRLHAFRCLKCRKYTRRNLDSKDRKSTGNMRKHAVACFGEAVVASVDEMAKSGDDVRTAFMQGKLRDGSITAAFERKGKGKVTYMHRQHTKTESKAEFVRWVSENLRPFEIAKDRGFLTLMKSGRPELYIPSPSTISRDVKLVFKKARSRIAQMLQEYDGALNFATDAWTSPNHRAFIAITVHLERDGIPLAFLLDLVEVPQSHSGLNLAKAFAQVLRDFGIEHKILSITTDNASSNDTMIKELADILDDFPGAPNQTRCFAHIVNIAAQNCIHVFDVPKKARGGTGEATPDDGVAEALRLLAEGIEDEEEEMMRERDETLDDELPENDDVWRNELDEMSDEEREELNGLVAPIRMMLVKLRKLAYSILHSSTLLLPQWDRILEDLKLAIRRMPRDVRTRWNSTYEMLKFAVEYRAAIDRISGDKDAKLRRFELSNDEWELASQMVEVLKVFDHATRFFSRSTPSLPHVIPSMDFLDETLTTQSLNTAKYQPSLRAALGIAKRTINRYYNKTDYSEVYRIAMMLHPKYKLEYFKDVEWDAEWITAAETILRDEFDRKYATSTLPTCHKPVLADTSATRPHNGKGKEVNMFDNLPYKRTARPPPNPSNEVTRYLSLPTEDIDDPLVWWHARRESYPRLSRMALDYLTIPATSVDVERVFSKGRLLLSHIRNRLGSQSTRALMCVGAWSRLGMIKDSDVIAVAKMADMRPDEEEEALDDGWDNIEV